MAGNASAVLDDRPALVEEVDSTEAGTREVQFQIWHELEQAQAFTPTHFLVPEAMTYETAEALANYLGQLKGRTSWYIGDLLLACENRWGELYAQVAHATGLAEGTLMNLVYVAKNVPPERRRPQLRHSVHALVAPLGAREQNKWLDKAVKNGWSRDDLKEAMRARRKDTAPPLHDDPEPGSAEEVLRAIIRDAKQHDDPGYWLIPDEDIERAKAALGIAAQAEADAEE